MSDSDAADGPAVGSHYCVTAGDGETTDGGPVGPGIYRVVGTTEATFTVLQVGDRDGRRVHTGHTVTVDRATLSAFEPAVNPDAHRSAGQRIAVALDGFRLSARQFGRSLAARPVPSVLAVALLLAGEVGARVVPGYDLLSAGAIIVGGLGLVYLGSLGME